MQRERVDAHAKAAILMAGILLAAGAFTGIMQGTGMLAAMAQAAVQFVPPGMAPHIPVRARPGLDAAQPAVRSGLVLLRRPAGGGRGRPALGVPPIQVGQAALLGQMTTGFPVSPLTPATFLVVGLTGIDLASTSGSRSRSCSARRS